MLLNRRILIFFISAILFIFAICISGIKNVFEKLFEFPLWTILSLLAFLLVNIVIVSYRFWRILKHFGVDLSWSVAFRANISGYVAGLFVINLFGQVVGRQFVLKNHGLKPIIIAGLTAYERAVLVLVAGTLCLIGAIYLLNNTTITEFIKSVSILEIVIAATAGIALSVFLGSSHFEKKISRNSFSRSNLLKILEISLLTFVSQLLILLSFVLCILAFDSDIGVLKLFSAASIISFAAALPITVNGWGVREITAVYVLGFLGISSANAVAISIMVGICSTLVVFALAPLSLRSNSIADSENTHMFKSSMKSDMAVLDFEKIIAWVLGMAVAVAVFFQAHISLKGGDININLADPFAILALAAVSVQVLLSRQLPRWNIKYINHALIAISLLLVFGFIHGWFYIGVTQWALAGRLIGWLILLGYLAVGYLITVYVGAHGRRRISETMIATAAFIVIMQVVLRLLDQWGLNPGANITFNFQGYAGNRNAFAFQLLICMALLLGYDSIYGRKKYLSKNLKNKYYIPCFLAIILSGLFWTSSRAGVSVAVLILIGARVFGLIEKRTLLIGLSLAIALCFFVWFSFGNEGISSHVSNMLSNQERLQSYFHAIELWKKSPIFGAGLGVFVEQSTIWSERPVVVHNTLLWVLAELGVIGLFVLISVYYLMFQYAFKKARSLPSTRILLLILIIFALFSQAHDVFYQRIFWLVMGVVLAKPFSSNKLK